MNEGKKFDSGKARVSLIPSDVIQGLADVLTFGANKYGDLNWTNGIKVSRLMDATYRHILKFQSGVDLDDESGKSHLLHAMCNLTFIYWTIRNKPEFDDRWENNSVQHPASCESRIENHREYTEQLTPEQEALISLTKTQNGVMHDPKLHSTITNYDLVMLGSKK